MNIYYDFITLFRNTFTLRRLRVANFADIIKIATMFIKAIFKDSKKLKELEVKMQSIFAFFGKTKVADFRWKNAHVSRTQAMCRNQLKEVSKITI